MRKIAIDKNVSKIKELQNIYPDKLKLMRSENDVKTVDFEVIIKGKYEDFDNADSDMPNFIADQLALGKEVAIFPAGKSKMMVFAGYGLFKRGW